LKVGVCEKNNYEPNILSWDWVVFHPIQKNPKIGFFGWCIGGCWVIQAHNLKMGEQN